MMVREGDEGDAAAVAELWTEAYADPGPEGRREPYALQEYFAVAAEAEVSVAVEDGGRGGRGDRALRRPARRGRSVAGPGEAELARLAVAADARRRGTGRALVEARRRAGPRAGRREGRALEPSLPDRCPPALRIARLPAGAGARRDDREGRRLVFVLDL